MKTLNKIMAVLVAATCVGNAVALPDVSVINTRVSNILDKIGVDGAGYSAGGYSITGSNDLGSFTTGDLDISSASTAQDIANVINAFNIENDTVYVPVNIDSVNGVRADGLESLLLDALAYKINEITGDIGDLTSSYADGKLAFETALNNGDAILAPSSVDYANADAQTWFGVKNSLDIFTKSTNGWVSDIRELNGDMDNDGVRDTGRVSHFDAEVVVGAEVVDYDSDQDVATAESLTVKTFASDGTIANVVLDLGYGYNRANLAAASVASGSTFASERNNILSGETIFTAARHAGTVDSLGVRTGDSALENAYASRVLQSIEDQASSIVTVTENVVPGTVDLDTFGLTGVTGVHTFSWTGTGWLANVGGSNVAVSTSMVNTSGVVQTAYASFIDSTNFVADSITYTTTLGSVALDFIISTELGEYAEDLLLGTVDTTSPQWLQDLATD